MGRMYTAVASSTQAVAGDIMEISAPSDAIVILHSVQVSMSDSETDDSTEIDISRWATSGSGGSTITASPMELSDTAFAGAVEAFNITDASSTQTRLYSEGISMLAGFQKIWTPEMRPIIPPSGILVVKFTADITSITMKVTVEFEEIG